MVLVQEFGTPRIFDIWTIRCVDYRKERIYHEVIEDQIGICEAIEKTGQEWEKGSAVNSIVRLLSLTKTASIPETGDAKIDPNMQLIMAELSRLREEIRTPRNSAVHIIEDRHREHSMEVKKLRYLEEILLEMIQKGTYDSELVDDLRNSMIKYKMAFKKTGLREYRDLFERYLSLNERASELLPKDDEASNN